MQKRNLVIIRSFLFKTFLIGFFFAILLFVLTVTFWDKWSFMVNSKFMVTPKELGEMFVNSMIYIRFYLLFVILVPAIALHWVVKTLKD